jgi:hypothetical protein
VKTDGPQGEADVIPRNEPGRRAKSNLVEARKAKREKKTSVSDTVSDTEKIADEPEFKGDSSCNCPTEDKDL